MIKEKLTIKTEETSINLSQTMIESVRKKNITKTGFRVYDDDKIGVTGAIGKYDEQEMWGKAKDKLSLTIEYPYEATGKQEKNEELACDIQDGVAFTREIEEMLKVLREKQPDFIFSNKINLTTNQTALENDLGLNLNSRISKISSSVIIKEKSSKDLADAFVGFEGAKWDKDEFIRLVDMTCSGLKKDADIENGVHKVVILPMMCDFLGKMYTELHGLKFGTGGSLFSGKTGEKLFSDNFTLFQSRANEDGNFSPFFDVEGTINAGNRFPLIENGVLKTPYTDKKTAAQYNLTHTGSAGGEYDSVPTLSPTPLVIEKSNQTLKELLDGEEAIFVLMASGGDFTPEGKYATPVQTSFLYDGEQFIGRLPQLNLTSNIYDMFGKDFFGVSSDSLTSLSPVNMPVINMKVEKI